MRSSDGTSTRLRWRARELVRLSLIGALALVMLYARVGSPKFEPAAVRWLAQLALEGRKVGPATLQMAAAARACVSSRKRDRRARTRAQPAAQPPAEAGGIGNGSF